MDYQKIDYQEIELNVQTELNSFLEEIKRKNYEKSKKSRETQLLEIWEVSGLLNNAKTQEEKIRLAKTFEKITSYLCGHAYMDNPNYFLQVETVCYKIAEKIMFTTNSEFSENDVNKLMVSLKTTIDNLISKNGNQLTINIHKEEKEKVINEFISSYTKSYLNLKAFYSESNR